MGPLGRRDWLRLLAVLSAARADGADVQFPITKESLAQALRLIGLDFSAEQQALMLPLMNRQLAQYEELRKVEVPLDTEPAFTFRPLVRPVQNSAVFRPPHPRRMSPPASEDDLAFLTVAELSSLLRSRAVTSVDLTRIYLRRLKRFGPKLNCVVTLTEDLALEQAQRADKEMREGRHRGPLHGIPWGAKDLFATKGIPTTWGAEPFRDQVFDFNATVVERLEDAGAVLVAKLSMGALAQGGLWFGGMTRTPWNLDESSSGSSAGPAAATAAGLVGFSIGTETLGSIVSPCMKCGVTGLRPTYGRVSRYGAMGLSWTMDKIGPICRSAADCALVLHAIYGPDGRDRTVLDHALEWDSRQPLSALRIGIIQSDFDKAAGESKPALDGAVEALRGAGAKLVPVEFPANKSGAIRFLLTAEAAAAFDDITRDRKVEELRGQGPGDWPNSFRSARLIPAVEYIRAQRARTLLMEQIGEFMQDWDVLVGSPSSTLVATNLTGHPQLVVPCGLAAGMPVSILFTGQTCREGPIIQVAHAFQRVTDWHRKPPKMDWA
jgi:Asp-tRNA(Asn)/Glu-tRNA(Gln) amidotransferase A subunit family amidase